MKAGHTDGCSEYSEDCQCDEVIKLRAELAALKAPTQPTVASVYMPYSAGKCSRCQRSLAGQTTFMLSNTQGAWCSDWCRAMRNVPMELIT